MSKKAFNNHIIDEKDLHHSIQDSTLRSITFLNEIIDEYPSAISFAPGAPNNKFFKEIDLLEDINRFTDYLRLEKCFSEEKINRILYQYGPSAGQINEILCRSFLIEEGLEISPDSLVVTVGCQEAIFLILRALFKQTTDVLGIINPSFVGAAGAASILELNIKSFSIFHSNGELDISKFKESQQLLIDSGEKLKVLYIAPDFSNPSGLTIDINARIKLLTLAEDEDFYILEDNTYRFFHDETYSLPSLKSLDKNRRVIYVGTFAKILFPGARVGFIIADQIVKSLTNKSVYLAHHLAAIKNMVTVNTSPICQAIVAGSILRSKYSLKNMSYTKKQFYKKNLELLILALEKYLGEKTYFKGLVSWNKPPGGFFVILTVPFEINEKLLEISAKKFDVIWTPMNFFSIAPIPNNQMRLSCSYLEPNQIEIGVINLAKFIKYMTFKSK